MQSSKLPESFFKQDVLTVAPGILGKKLVRIDDNGFKNEYIITEAEAYKGIDDLACHASKGKTLRNAVMFDKGGLIYVYLIYGMYWMFNIVTSVENDPQAVLIRGIENYKGPGKLTKNLGIDKSFNGEHICESQRIWIEDSSIQYEIKTGKRIGIDYAGDYWKNVDWRFYITL